MPRQLSYYAPKTMPNETLHQFNGQFAYSVQRAATSVVPVCIHPRLVSHTSLMGRETSRGGAEQVPVRSLPSPGSQDRHYPSAVVMFDADTVTESGHVTTRVECTQSNWAIVRNCCDATERASRPTRDRRDEKSARPTPCSAQGTA